MCIRDSFNGGEAKFAELLRQLETAEHYIFLEYFIIDEGLMWGRILEVLARNCLLYTSRAVYRHARPVCAAEGDPARL